MVVPRAFLQVPRAAATVVPCAVLRRSCPVRLATVVPRAVLRRSWRVQTRRSCLVRSCEGRAVCGSGRSCLVRSCDGRAPCGLRWSCLVQSCASRVPCDLRRSCLVRSCDAACGCDDRVSCKAVTVVPHAGGAVTAACRSCVRCLDVSRACGALMAMLCRVRLRWSCHVQLCAGHAACGAATAVPLRRSCVVRSCDGRAACDAVTAACRSWVRCLDVSRACGASMAVLCRVRLRWSCHVQLCAGHAACGAATAVPRARCCDGRAMCGAAIVVPCVFVRRSCHVRAATVVSRALLRRLYSACCVRWQRGGVTPTAVGPCSGAAA